MGNPVADIVRFIFAGLLPVLIMIGVFAFSAYMTFYDYFRDGELVLNKVAGFIGGLVVFAFFVLVLSSPIVQEVIDIPIDPLYSLLGALICGGPMGALLGILSSSLAYAMLKDDFFGVLLGSLCAGALTALYAFATAQVSFRLVVAGLALGFLFGVILYVIPNATRVANRLSKRTPTQTTEEEVTAANTVIR